MTASLQANTGRQQPLRGAGELDILTLSAGGQTFGLPTADVRSVTRLAALTRVPGAPAAILGLGQVHGRIVAVACLARLLGLEKIGACPPAMLVTLANGDLALAVDAVGAPQSFCESDVVTLPIPSCLTYSAMILKIYRGTEANLPVLDARAMCRFGTPG